MNRKDYTRPLKDGVQPRYYDYDEYDNQYDEYEYFDTPRPLEAGWSDLTPREQQVTWLVCQPKPRGHFTNREIASCLAISPETVKIHVRHVLSKFNLHSKAELRQALAEWDFGDWKNANG